VEAYERIRQAVINEGLSQREAAQRLGHSRKTVAKALKFKIPPGYRLNELRHKPVLEPVRQLIDEWIRQNKDIRPKQRMTAHRIYGLCQDSCAHFIFCFMIWSLALCSLVLVHL